MIPLHYVKYPSSTDQAQNQKKTHAFLKSYDHVKQWADDGGYQDHEVELEFQFEVDAGEVTVSCDGLQDDVRHENADVHGAAQVGHAEEVDDERCLAHFWFFGYMVFVGTWLADLQELWDVSVGAWGRALL